MRTDGKRSVENDPIVLPSDKFLHLLRARAVADPSPQNDADQNSKQYPNQRRSDAYVAAAGSPGGSASTTAGDFGGRLTGLPHFRQNCASSGRLAPHLLHPSRTLAAGRCSAIGRHTQLLSDFKLKCEPYFAKKRKTCGAFCVPGPFFKTQKCQQILAQVRANRYLSLRRIHRGCSVRNPRSATMPSASTARIIAPHRIPLCRSDHGRSSGRPVYCALCAPGPSCACAGERST